MRRETIIYGLADPITGHLRYVGKTVTEPRRRLDAHMHDARRGVRRPCASWIRKLLKQGVQPEIFEIETCPAEIDWEEAEQFWISYFRFIGCSLLNLSIGGEAGTLGWKASDETKRRMSAARTGFVISEESKRKRYQATSDRTSRSARDRKGASRRIRRFRCGHQ